MIMIINRPLAAKLNPNAINPPSSPPTVDVAADSSFSLLKKRAITAAIKCVNTSYELPSKGGGGGGGWRRTMEKGERERAQVAARA
jgi:hypothetical protein